MGVRAFVDTNVLLRSLIKDLPLYAEADELVKQARQDGFELWISRQVLREFLVQITRTGLLTTPMTVQECKEQVKHIEATFKIADDTNAISTKLMELLEAYPTAGKQIHDANIVATMLVNEIEILLTGNIKDFKRFADKIKIRALISDETESG